MNNHNTISGLEILQKMLTGELDHPKMADTITMKVVEAQKGFIIIHAMAGEQHKNHLGCVHGGFSATVLDTSGGCAIHSALETDKKFGTIDLNVKMIRPVPFQEEVIAEAKLISLTKSLGVAESTLFDKNRRVLAHATTTCFILNNS